jgi:hypothetical protein
MKKQYLYSLFALLAIASSGLAIWAAQVSSSSFKAQSGTQVASNSKAEAEAKSAAVQIPSPEEALQQAQKLSPEQISQLEIDEVIRDRLRFDPEWRKIADEVRRDIMVLKFGYGKIEKPIWERYGAKVYPLLDYYSRSRDAVRQTYGIAGIHSLGKPYTTLWLTNQLKRRLNRPDFDAIAQNPDYLIGRSEKYTEYNSKAWEKDYGLDDPVTRDRLIKIATENFESDQEAPSYYDQFNRGFLERLLGYEKVPGYKAYKDPDDIKNFAGLPQWVQYENLAQPTTSQIQAAANFFRGLSNEAREYILVQRLGKLKAGEITPFAREFFLALASDSTSADGVWAILELDRHDDPQGKKMLNRVINGDLTQLYEFSKEIGYEGYSDRNAYGYYLLLGITEKYPDSRFTKGCREYGDLIGKSYFNGEARNKAILDRNAQKTPQQRSQDWQQWLSRYPDHPGADDASYFLARSLQSQNDVTGALRLWLKMMIQPMGDRDALYLAWPHVRTLLDVGLSTAEIEKMLQEPEVKPIAPLFQYALAVRYARNQDYSKALDISKDINLSSISDPILGTYYNSKSWYGEKDRLKTVQAGMQAVLTEQKQRWQKLLELQQANTPDSRYQLASNWAGIGGWKNGYLPVWDGSRIYYLPTGSWDSSECEKWWACDAKQRSVSVVRTNYQVSSQNAVALSLYQNVLDDPNLFPGLREKTLFMVASTLLEQWEEHSLGETEIMHPPVGVTTSNKPISLDKYGYPDYAEVERRIQTDYQRRIDAIITELQVKFPQSTYTDDLLFTSFYLSEKPRYLKQILERYPNSDRAAEAKFLLERLAAKPKS